MNARRRYRVGIPFDATVGGVLNALSRVLPSPNFSLCVGDRLLTNDEAFPTDQVYLVANCFVDQCNPTGGEWQNLIAKHCARTPNVAKSARRRRLGAAVCRVGLELHVGSKLRANDTQVDLTTLGRVNYKVHIVANDVRFYVTDCGGGCTAEGTVKYVEFVVLCL